MTKNLARPFINRQNHVFRPISLAFFNVLSRSYDKMFMMLNNVDIEQDMLWRRKIVNGYEVDIKLSSKTTKWDKYMENIQGNKNRKQI